MAQQQQVLILTDGEKLRILIDRDGRSMDALAEAWGRTRQHITTYTKKDTLKPSIIKKACEILGVPESLFDPRLNPDHLLNELARLSRDVENLNHRVHVLEAEKSGLSDAIKILNSTHPRQTGN